MKHATALENLANAERVALESCSKKMKIMPVVNIFGFFTRMRENAQKAAAEQVKKAETQEFENRAYFFRDLIEVANSFTFVQFNGTNLTVKHDGYSDAKLAIKELQVLKKKASVKKREITVQYKDIRDEYNQSVGNRSSMAWTTGSGKFGTFIRAGVRANRAAERARMANIKQNKDNGINIFCSYFTSC